METCSYYPHLSHSSPRALAMVLALVSAIALSPLYVDHRGSGSRLEARWSSSGLVLPVVVAGLIFAIRTTTSSSKNRGSAHSHLQSADDDDNGGWMLRIGSSSWGLAGILVLLLFVVSWQDSVQHFFWR